jgi:ATP-binding cassette, subfamily B, bacterial
MAQRKGRWSAEDDGKKVSFKKEEFQNALKIFSFIKPYLFKFVVSMVLLGFSSVIFMIFTVASGEFINVATGKAKFGFSLNEIGIGLLCILVFQSVVSYIRVTLLTFVSEKSVADIRKALYNKILSFPITFFEKNRVGDLTSRTTNDVLQLQDALSITLAEFIRQFIVLILSVSYLFWQTRDLAFLMIATFPVIVVAALFFGRHIRKLSKARQDEMAETGTIIEETLQSIYAVKAYTNEYYESVRYGRSIDKVVNTSIKFGHSRGLFISFIISVLFGVMFFVLWQGAKLVAAGTMEAGTLVTFIVITGVIGGSIGGLGDLYTQLLKAIGASDRLIQILGDESEVKIEPHGVNNLKITGNIEYKNVHFSYPTRQDVTILKGLNMSVKAGQKIALVGTSGGGKSTIVQLLQRFYDVSSGEILVDGKNVSEYDVTDYRRNLGIVPQEVLLFGGTILENILYGNPQATENQVIEASKKANAWEFISSFPEGLQTVVGERGIKLSGGQRQRIAIARAILKDPKILILDEATSSLDAESERVVQDALNTLMEGRTSVVIAHRLATIREVDCIYVIDGGKIVESGTHEELSSLENGIYNNLAKLQFEEIAA